MNSKQAKNRHLLSASWMVIALFALNMCVSESAQAADVKQLFNFYCAQCHGVTGKGNGVNAIKELEVLPRDFTNKAEMAKRSDDDITTVIKRGGPAISKSTLMPPWGDTISEEDVEALLVYIRAFAK